MPPLKNFILLTLQLVVQVAARNCRCGFSVNSTSSPQHQIFTDYLETDFTQGNHDGWTPQEWTIDKKSARGPYGRSTSLKNVVLTKEGMQLWVRKPIDEIVDTAEVGSDRTDMLYGSFRMRAKMGTANGTCGAMFWYHNNTQEIDMEFLSKQFNESDGSNINLVLQSPESQAAGFNAIYTPGFARPHLPFRPDKDFHEYRFDWTHSQVAFYADNKLLHVMTESIPDSGGHMVFNHWSNGNPGWSAGPPAEDTFMVVSHAHFYFNSSDLNAQKRFAKDCSTLDTTQVCEIDDEDITHNLMPPIGAEGSSSNPYSPGAGAAGSEQANSSSSVAVATAPDPNPHSWAVSDDEIGNTERQRATTIYVAVGVVVGLIILGFIGCMMTVRYWVALKERIKQKLGRRRSGHVELEAQELKDGLRLKTPDTELGSQVSPVKSHEGSRF